MQELERMIDIYHTAYTVFLVLTIVFLALTIFMFIKFDIRRIIDMKTGRGAKKSIQRMEEINAQTGKLRQEVADTPSRLKAEERIAYPVTAQNLQVQAEVRNRADSVSAQNNSEMPIRNVSITRPDQGTETTILNDSSETTILYQEDPGTTVLSGKQMAAEKIRRKLPGNFHIEKEILWVHTKEVL